MRVAVKQELHEFYANHHIEEGDARELAPGSDVASLADDQSVASDGPFTPSKIGTPPKHDVPTSAIPTSSSQGDASDNGIASDSLQSLDESEPKKLKTFKSVSDFWGAFGKGGGKPSERV